MRTFTYVDNKKGVTIIELMITLAMILIVIGLSYLFYFYVVRSFEISSTQSAVQENVRLAKNLIDKEIRRASYIKIEEPPDDVNKYNHHIMTADGKIKKDTNYLLGNLSEGVEMGLLFTKTSDSFIEVTVTGSIDGDYEYSITSEVLALGGNIDNSINDSGDEIYFKYE
ncbi:PilW family protein [Desulfotomaculum sp. 1211_IL3151]|uniref:PilW family protein n=1 Tax=Desulfotomaculum sp. 1211_IL3151 TaxID=3084055 RepID=UPI002FD961BC